jgi:Domain of unknown function (DUF4265)
MAEIILRDQQSRAAVHARSSGDGGLIRVLFELVPDADDPNWPPSTAETMWAEPAGVDSALLRNIPFYVRGIAYDDLILLKPKSAGDDTPLTFDRVIQHRGHSTYRAILQSAEDPVIFGVWWQRLADLGCCYERANSALVAIDMPPGVDVHKAYQVLQLGEAESVWGFEEGFYSGGG